jgi:hypothetical protein
MRLFLFSIVAALLFSAAPAYFGQAQKKTARSKSKRPVAGKSIKTVEAPIATYDVPPPPEPARKTTSSEHSVSDVFRDVLIGKWGITRLSIPRDMMGGKDSPPSSLKGKDVTITDYSRNWRHPAPVDPFLVSVDLMVTNWDTDFSKILPGLSPDLATPVMLVLADIHADIKSRDTPGSPVKDARPLVIDGARGGFFHAEYPDEENRFIVGWYTYRHFKGKAQRISLTVTGRKSELPKAMKIIESLKLQ